ncbi:hypothetical protein ABKN59_006971 [Abortiporus biennis]
MSLDQNLFTLNLVPNKDDPNVLDLVDPSGNSHYKKVRVPGTVYKVEVYDPLSESLLATATAPSASSKHKTIELYNPSVAIELKYTGTLTFKWKFKWEEHEFEWKREECFIIRKPDPAVLVAVTKEPPGRLKTSTVQILDYNLNRFDIDDRKGLEIVMLTALLTFGDSNEALHTPEPTPVSTPSGSTISSTPSAPTSVPDTPPLLSLPSGPAPMIPPKPAPKTGIERIAELHAIRTAQGEGEANEVEVSMEGTVDDYARYAEGLLKDDAMLFVTLKSASATQVPKVLAVVEQVKRIRHKAGIEDQLFQYILYDAPSKKGPKRIVLDDPIPTGKPGYKPPSSLAIHLSKIDMPELQLRADPNSRPPPKHSDIKPKLHSEDIKVKKEDKKKDKEKKEKEKDKKSSDPKLKKASHFFSFTSDPPSSSSSSKSHPSSPAPPIPNKHTKPSFSSSSPPFHPQPPPIDTQSSYSTSSFDMPSHPPFTPFGSHESSSPFFGGGPPELSFPSVPVSQPSSPFHGSQPSHISSFAQDFYGVGTGTGYNSMPPSGAYGQNNYSGYNPSYL